MEEESSDEESSISTPMPPRKMVPPSISGNRPLIPAPRKEPLQQPPPLPPIPEKVLVKKGYDPKQGMMPFLNPLCCT